MSHASSIEQNPNNFLLLRHRPIFAIALYALRPQEIDGRAFIADARIISGREVEVWILDGSEFADRIRTQTEVYFEIDLLDGSCLRGSASASLGESRIGPHERRYVEARLILENANVEIIEKPPAKWLT